MRRRTLAAAASLVVAAIAVAGAGAKQLEPRSLTASKSTTSNGRIQLSVTLKSQNNVSGCYAGVPVRLERLRPTGWVAIRRGRTNANGLLSWTVVGFKSRARAVAPRLDIHPAGTDGVICRPVILGFDRGYLSP
jgi:hypothetical protein